MLRVAVALSVIALAGLVGCKKPPSPEQIAKMRGGKTTVVVYGFCIPMDHLIKTAMTRATLTYVVNGKLVGTMKSCSYARFSVPSGYWSSKFTGIGFFGSHLPEMAFHPGKTQYLHMRPAGHSTYSGHWVSKAQADQGIAAIRQIGQMF